MMLRCQSSFSVSASPSLFFPNLSYKLDSQRLAEVTAHPVHKNMIKDLFMDADKGLVFHSDASVPKAAFLLFF